MFSGQIVMTIAIKFGLHYCAVMGYRVYPYTSPYYRSWNLIIVMFTGP